MEHRHGSRPRPTGELHDLLAGDGWIDQVADGHVQHCSDLGLLRAPLHGNCEEAPDDRRDQEAAGAGRDRLEIQYRNDRRLGNAELL